MGVLIASFTLQSFYVIMWMMGIITVHPTTIDLYATDTTHTSFYLEIGDLSFITPLNERDWALGGYPLYEVDAYLKQNHGLSIDMTASGISEGLVVERQSEPNVVGNVTVPRSFYGYPYLSTHVLWSGGNDYYTKIQGVSVELPTTSASASMSTARHESNNVKDYLDMSKQFFDKKSIDMYQTDHQ